MLSCDWKIPSIDRTKLSFRHRKWRGNEAARRVRENVLRDALAVFSVGRFKQRRGEQSQEESGKRRGWDRWTVGGHGASAQIPRSPPAVYRERKAKREMPVA